MTSYLHIVRRWWWIILIVTATAGVTVALLVNDRPTLYQSEGTFLVRPRSVNQEDAVRAFDTLIRGAEINATYAAIARSDVVKDRAMNAVTSAGPDDAPSVTTEIVTGTNILRLIVTGQDRAVAQEFAQAMADEIVSYVGQLGDAYLLAPLDGPSIVGPVPQHRRVTIALGALAGMASGLLLALGFERLWPRRPVQREQGNGVLDEAAMRMRLESELKAARKTGHQLAVVTLASPSVNGHGSHGPADAAEMAAGLQAHLREAISVGILGDRTIVAFSAGGGIDGTRRLVAEWQRAHRGSATAGGVGDQLDASVVVYEGGKPMGDPRARHVLETLVQR